MPTLLIQGSDDKVTPSEANAAAFVAAMPGARLELLEGFGHLPEVEAPARVNALIQAFLWD